MPAWSKEKYARLAKGYRGRNNHCYKLMVWRVEKGMQKAYKDRRRKRRLYRRSWISNINAASREHGLAYSRLIYGLNRSNMQLDRKILSNLATHEPFSFKALVDEVKIQAKIGMLDESVAPMSYYQALSERQLVFGTVKPPADEDKHELPYIRIRNDIDPKLKEQLMIDEGKHALDRSLDWVFKQK